MNLNLKGFLFDIDGQYDLPIPIDTEVDMSDFLIDNIDICHEMKVLDANDMTVFHVIDQVLLFPIPEHGNKNNRWNKELGKFVTID